MRTDITFIIADLLRQSSPEFDSRLGFQQEALSESKCTNPLIGGWIDAYDVKHLLSALQLKDNDFAEFFPAFADFKQQDRQLLVATIKSHFDTCQHCSLKRGYDYELDAKIKNVCLQNRTYLLEMLDEKAETAEGEHPKTRVAEG